MINYVTIRNLQNSTNTIIKTFLVNINQMCSYQIRNNTLRDINYSY